MTSCSDRSIPGIWGSTRCRARPIEPTSSTPRTHLLTLGPSEASWRSDAWPCTQSPVFEPLGVKPELGRIPKQLSKSHVRTQRDDLEVEQICLRYRKRSDESLGFRHLITLQDQHDPRSVVRSQIEFAHLIAFVALPHATRLFAYVRSDVFPPDPASRMPNGQYLHVVYSVQIGRAHV